MSRSREIGKFFSGLIASLGILMILIGFLGISVEKYFSFLIAGGFLLFLGGILVYNFRYSEYNCFSLSHNYNVIRNQQSKKKTTKKNFDYIYVKARPIKGTICMISKTLLDDQDKVLQCPKCNSYFVESYLVEWIEEHITCPVCKYPLKIKD